MLNKKVEEALNAQINAEMWSAYLYLSMAAYCHANGNPGMGNWFQVQFQEEQDHAKIMFNYIIQRGGHVELKAIDAVPTTWENPLDVLSQPWHTSRRLPPSSTTSSLLLPRKMTMPHRACSSGLLMSRWRKKRTPRTSSTTFA